jgi:DNA-binding transcriptional regulator YdaS (Cro superfamily)
MSKKDLRAGLNLAIAAMADAAGKGGKARLARAIGISPQALHQWTRIPYDRITQVEKVTGVPREQLRPDLYRKADARSCRAVVAL